MFNDLKNKFFLITGAGGFLGLYHCKAVLEKDGFLIMCDKNKQKNIKNYKILKKLFPDSKIIIKNFDITKHQQINKIKKDLEKKNIYIDVLINNAAIDSVPSSNKVIQNNNNDILESFNVGVLGPVNLIEIFSKDMKKKSGSIINIGSDLSLIAPNQKIYKGLFKNFIKPIHYSISKHAIIGVTKYYASLLGNFNIRCNALCPGPIFNNQKKSFKKRLENIIPLGRMGNPDELIGTIQYLSSEASSYINGQTIVVDGGRTII